MSSDKISQLQLLQRNMQTILAQKQQIQGQVQELDSALAELQKTEKSYKIIGTIMVSTPNDSLCRELRDRK